MSSFISVIELSRKFYEDVIKKLVSQSHAAASPCWID